MGWILFKDTKTHLLIFFFKGPGTGLWGGGGDIRMIMGIY